jgi:hypothetical protein
MIWRWRNGIIWRERNGIDGIEEIGIIEKLKTAGDDER